MAVYTVHEPPLRKRKRETETDPMRFAFVRDGFSFWAFLLGPLWMLRHRLWLVLIGYLVVAVGLAVGLRWLGACRRHRLPWSACCLRCWSGSRPSTLRRWTLARRGWHSLGVVVADDVELAERRFFDAWTGQAPVPAQEPASRRRRSRPPAPRRQPVAAGRDRPVSPAGNAAVTVAIVDYGSGNLHSAQKAFERAARESGHDQPIVVTGDPEAVRRADRIVLPGVGAFADCRRGLDAMPGMVEALEESRAPQRAAVPRHLRRHAADGRARARVPGDRGPRLDRRRGRPHRAGGREPEDSAHGLEHAQRTAMPHPLLAGIPLGPHGLHAYFVHSYHLKVERSRRPRGRGRLWRPGHRDRRRARPMRAPSSIRRRASGWACG